ncbi:hypothetical protein L204_100768 [Cryptococcus depauperatus]|nr:hypothetical protein L204_01300 [Cryptococcus depauperatus CBS 7855]
MTQSRSLPNKLQPLLPLCTSSVLNVPRPPALAFFRQPGHVIPTKWSLYRPLIAHLKVNPGQSYPHISREIRSLWKKNKGLTSVPQVQGFLTRQYDLLWALQADSRDELQELEQRLTRKHECSDSRKRAQESKEALQSASKPPRLTGAFHRPTLFNPPLPRLKPQPIGLSMMIHNRLRARERRMEKRKLYASLRVDMLLEVSFWKQVEVSRRSKWAPNKNSKSPGGWDAILKEELKTMDARFARENMRAEMVFEEPMLQRIKRAKVRKLQWWKMKKEAKQR